MVTGGGRQERRVRSGTRIPESGQLTLVGIGPRVQEDRDL
jgi:hypothetical protein